MGGMPLWNKFTCISRFCHNFRTITGPLIGLRVQTYVWYALADRGKNGMWVNTYYSHKQLIYLNHGSITFELILWEAVQIYVVKQWDPLIVFFALTNS